jgi:hypothetical protein
MLYFTTAIIAFYEVKKIETNEKKKLFFLCSLGFVGVAVLCKNKKLTSFL